MMQCILPLVLVILAIADGRPQHLEDSISSVIKSLEAAEPPRISRPRIITKYDFMNTRDKKSHLDLPPEFVVSTGLTVTEQKQNEASSQRSGRSQKLFGSRQAKTNFVNLKEAVAAAPLVNGMRLPDDESDRVVHRNGRFINNIFVPNSANFGSSPSPSKFLPMEFLVRTQIDGQGKKQLERSARSFLSQNEGLDKSAYTFEPSDPYASQQQQANVLQASQDDFVIRQQTYQSCPGCPTFSIPVPVPKASAFPNEVSTPLKKKTIMERLMALVQPALSTAREFFSPDSEQNEGSSNGFANRVSAVQESGQSKLPMYAGMAAIGLGLATMLSSGVVGGRSMGAGRRLDEDIFESLNIIGNDLFDYDIGDNDVLEYDMDDILCMPRNYCEKLQRKKYLIDQYPNMKLVASWMAEKYFEGVDISENQVYSQCNVRECIMTLLD